MEELEARLETLRLEYEEKKADALVKIEDAKKEIEDIDMTKWYLQDRTSLSGYSNVKNDADSIQAIGDIFPVLFLVVAILVSLTTITRMVEEERGLIGTYKALVNAVNVLGYTDIFFKEWYKETFFIWEIVVSPYHPFQIYAG